MKNIGSYRKYDIFFNFHFTNNMIFPSIAENSEKMIFTLSVFTKMLFFHAYLNFSNLLAPRKFWVIFANWEERLFLFVTKICRKACTLIFLDKAQYCRRCLAQEYYRNTADFKHYQLYVLNAALHRSGFSVRHFLLFELTRDEITCTV